MKRERINEPRALDSQNVCTLKFTSSLVTARLDLRRISTAIALNPLFLTGGIQGPGTLHRRVHGLGICSLRNYFSVHPNSRWDLFSQRCCHKFALTQLLLSIHTQLSIRHPCFRARFSKAVVHRVPGPFPFVEPTTSPRKDHNASTSHLMGHVFTTFENNIREVAVQVSL